VQRARGTLPSVPISSRKGVVKSPSYCSRNGFVVAKAASITLPRTGCHSGANKSNVGGIALIVLARLSPRSDPGSLATIRSGSLTFPWLGRCIRSIKSPPFARANVLSFLALLSSDAIRLVTAAADHS
jgi:hypothetical protein